MLGEMSGYDPAAIVVDPQIPAVARHRLALLALPPPRGVVPVATGLARFRDPPPEVPPPPRSPRAAGILAAVAGVLLVVSVATGLLGSLAAGIVPLAVGLACGVLAARAQVAAGAGRPALAGGLIRLAPASDLTEYYVTHAGQLFHRRYVRPHLDLDQEAMATWSRAVSAANRIFRAQALRDRAVDTDRVTSDVPELLWRVAEGLAMISDIRINIRNIVHEQESRHPAVEAKLRAQERLLARGTGQVETRIGRLAMLASRLDAADAALRGETALKRLNEVDVKIHDLVASTSETASDIAAADGLQVDVEAVIELTNQAIWDLSAQDEEEDSGG